jgi:hypothetical protein
MIYRTEALVRQQHLQQPQHQHLLAYPRLQYRVACWSGHHLLQCAQWLLRYGQQYEQWKLGMNIAGHETRNWERSPRHLF